MSAYVVLVALRPLNGGSDLIIDCICRACNVNVRCLEPSSIACQWTPFRCVMCSLISRDRNRQWQDDELPPGTGSSRGAGRCTVCWFDKECISLRYSRGILRMCVLPKMPIFVLPTTRIDRYLCSNYVQLHAYNQLQHLDAYTTARC